MQGMMKHNCGAGVQGHAMLLSRPYNVKSLALTYARARSFPAQPLREPRGGFARGARKHTLQTFTRRAVASDHASIEAEKSDLVFQEILLFLLQLECDSQLQRALNYENYEAAQDVRNRRTQVDEALSLIQDSKVQRVNNSQVTSKERWDLGAEVLRLRGELQRAVDEERYSEAATLRDQLAAVQGQSKAAERAASAEGEAAAELPKQRLRLGQRVKHVLHGYRGVICGWDIPCGETKEWQKAAGVERLPDGAFQPFYHVLVDVRDWPELSRQPPVTYVAEELLIAPEEPSSWVVEQGADAFQHPYNYLLFLGTDERGDLLPARALRERYSQPRRDVFPPAQP